MKKDKSTIKLMRRIVSFEKRRTLHWFEMVMVSGLIVLVCELWFMSELISEMQGMRSFDVIRNLSSETWEILRYELPWVKVHKALIALTVLILLGIYILMKFGIRNNRWKQIKKFEFEDK